MSKEKVPAYISHIVLVHAGSYNDFLNKLTSKYPDLFVIFCKRKATHYYILQLEDHSNPGVKKEDIYSLPIMAMREEFSSFIFFKNSKGYNNVLKRMCGGKDDSGYDLCQEMLTPFEKSVLLHLEDAKSLEYEEVGDKGEKTHHYIYNNAEINSIKIYSKLFGLSKVKVNDKEESFGELIKQLTWQIGIH